MRVINKISAVLVVMLIVVSITACGSSSFSLEGKWKSVGDEGFGQAQPGKVVVFDGTNCNFFSPQDTYAFYQENGKYKLDTTSMIFSQTLTFDVKIIDNDNIEISNSSTITKLMRVE